MKLEYFPPEVFDDDPGRNEYIVTWYSDALTRMDEPSLWEASDDRAAHSYRFLWLRTFHAPVAVRLEITDEPAPPTGFLTIKIAAYGDSPPVVDHRPLSPEQVAEFCTALEALPFWELPTREEETGGRDGAEWILEGVRHGRHHVVDRWWPETGAFRQTALLLLQLSGHEISPIY